MNKQQKQFREILFETIDSFVDSLDVKKPNILKELFTLNTTNFVKNMSGQDIDDDTELDTELWDWFLDILQEAINENSNEWIEFFKAQKIKILCYKYFTKKDLIKAEKIGPHLRKDIKKYFSSLQNYSDLNSFRERVENLPSDLLTNLVRFIFHKFPDLKNKIKVKKEEFKEKVTELTTERLKAAEKISTISKKYQTVLNLEKIKNLYNHGVFFEDNIINRGVNEYLVKLINYDIALKAMKEVYTGALLNDLKYQAENSSSYVKHIESISKEETQPFFSEKGYQIGNRFQSAIQEVKEKDYTDSVINKDSVFEEPTGKVNQTSWETNDLAAGDTENDTEGGSSSGGAGSSSGGSFGGGGGAGGFAFDEPDPASAPGAEGPEENGVEGNIEGGAVENSDEPETELPTDEETGLPVDFGSQETNPEAAKKGKENG